MIKYHQHPPEAIIKNTKENVLLLRKQVKVIMKVRLAEYIGLQRSKLFTMMARFRRSLKNSC